MGVFCLFVCLLLGVSQKFSLGLLLFLIDIEWVIILSLFLLFVDNLKILLLYNQLRTEKTNLDRLFNSKWNGI